VYVAPVARLDGKTALITGGARGRGAAEADRSVAEGAMVHITDVLVETASRRPNGSDTPSTSWSTT
jgi:NAD(P)-dependent dehydrogenase (short-subunit alcohol dehydrogenase family)